MDRTLDEAMNELAKERARYDELMQRLSSQVEWADKLYKGLKRSCERILAAADTKFFDKTAEDRDSAVITLMTEYINEVDYVPRHHR